MTMLPDLPILAGVDGSESALAAVRWAALEAQGLRAPLRLVTVFGWVPAPDLEDPQLIIRTGGELRLSNFLLWESAYSELYFSEKMWPDFDREEFERAVSSYGTRDYRFGGR